MKSKKIRIEDQVRDVMKKLDAAISYGKGKIESAGQKRPFVIVVCGAFSTGKTSLINALLECDLPTGINPITKIVTKLRYGPKKRFLLHRMSTNEEWEISDTVAAAVIVNRERDLRYQEFQIYIEVPSPFLEQGVILVDTPGFEDDEKEKLDELTKAEIRNADFCIANFSCNRFGTKDERTFLQELQEMTNGNFIAVLNCSNYLMQAGQIEDLTDRADTILKDFGNSYIGAGNYFVVDSRRINDFPKGSPEAQDACDLDGLDSWLEDILKHKSWRIQADTPLSMALAEVKAATKACSACMRDVTAQMRQYQELNQRSVQAKKRELHIQVGNQVQELRNYLLGWQDREFMKLGQSLKDKLRNISRDEFQVQATEKIRIQTETLGIQLNRLLEGRGITCKKSIGERFGRIAAAFFVSEPTYTLHERGIFDVDRYLYGKYYKVYNNYAGEAMNLVHQKLFPRLKKAIEEYVEDYEKEASGRLERQIKGDYEEKIEELAMLSERLSAKSLEALELQREIRMLRQNLMA